MEESVTPPSVVDEQESDEFWQGHLEKYKAFQGSSREYCKQNGLKYGRFYRFKQKLGFTKGRSPYRKAFVEIKAVESSIEKEPKVKVFSRQPSLPDPKWVAQFLKELLGQ